MTTIRDLVARIDEVDDDDRFEVGPAIFAQPPFTPDSEAVFLREDFLESRTRPGFRMVLDVLTAREAVSVWSKWRGDQVPSADDATAAVIYYANHDAYLPVADGE